MEGVDYLMLIFICLFWRRLVKCCHEDISVLCKMFLKNLWQVLSLSGCWNIRVVFCCIRQQECWTESTRTKQLEPAENHKQSIEAPEVSGGKVIFHDFFPGVKCFFLVENFHFGRPKTNFSCFEKWKAKKKKSSPHFVTFHFPPSFLQFSFFSSPFPPFSLFSLLLFSRYVGQQKFPSQKSLGCTRTPRLLRHCVVYC